MSLFSELRRRNVFRVAAAYAVVAWLIVQVGDVAADNLGFPDWFMPMLFVLLALGFPVAVFLAWAFELTPDGMKRETDVAPDESIAPKTGRKLDRLIIGVLALAVAVLVGERFWPGTSGPVDAEIDQSIAVLPFDSLSDEPEQGYFADGLTEEILNALAALPELLVTARTSSFFYKGKDVPVDEIADRLGVAHILEGSVRRDDERLRVTAQLIRASDGFNLWSRTYDRSMDDIFAVQTDIASEVAAALGILLDGEKRQRMEEAGVRDPEAYSLFAQGYELFRRAHQAEVQIEHLIEANRLFDQAFERAPRFWVARYHSADLYSHHLLDIASGVDPSTLPLSDVEEIRRELERRLRSAARVAPNEAARDFIEISRQVNSEDWTGLKQKIQRAYTHTESCGYDQWSTLGIPFGLADAAREFTERNTRCNAINASAWLQAASAALYDGDPIESLEITQQGLETADIGRDGSGIAYARMKSLFVLGRVEEARAELRRLVPAGGLARTVGLTMFAAMTGDAEALDVFRQELEQESDPAVESLGLRMYIAARGGDLERANRLASEIDARPAGPLQLMNLISNCTCGAPFDLDATPNLAARLDEAGLAWPPTETIDWPLKDW